MVRGVNRKKTYSGWITFVLQEEEDKLRIFPDTMSLLMFLESVNNELSNLFKLRQI